MDGSETAPGIDCAGLVYIFYSRNHPYLLTPFTPILESAPFLLEWPRGDMLPAKSAAIPSSSTFDLGPASSIAFAAASAKSSKAYNGRPLSAIYDSLVSLTEGGRYVNAPRRENGNLQFSVLPPGSFHGSAPPPATASPAPERPAPPPLRSCRPG